MAEKASPKLSGQHRQLSGLAGIVLWDGSPVPEVAIRRMMQLIAHRGTDGITYKILGGCALGQARLVLKREELDRPQILWHPDGRLGITADVRLYNRSALLGALKHSDWLGEAPSDTAILLGCWIEWGCGMLNHLDGDFAFAIYDMEENKVFAARDPFGIKPFFYHFDDLRFLFGSEPKQILAQPEISDELDDMIIGEFLVQSFEDHRRTFFAQVARLRPAHYLEVDSNGVRERRYWNPTPVLDDHYDTPEKIIARFRELFRGAVLKRLNTDWAVAAQLSGGYDSSSIVVMAGEIYKSNEKGLPNFLTVSAVYPGLECDESVYIDSVTECVRFESAKFDPRGENLLSGLEEEIGQLDSPFTDIQRGLFNLTAQTLVAKDGRLLLTGLGGDELVHEEYYLQDLALRGRYWLLLKESWRASKLSWNTFPTLLRQALSCRIPGWIKKSLKPFRRKKGSSLPTWLNPDFIDYFSQCPEPPPPPKPGFASLTQDAVIQFMNYPSVCWALEALETKCAYKGFEVTHPFMDRPLTEFVASIPLELRMPSGQWKYLLHEGLNDLLPREILARTRKTKFDALNIYMFRTWSEPLLRLVFNHPGWRSEKFIAKQSATDWFPEALQADVLDNAASNAAWRLLNTEIWLRKRYTGAMKHRCED